MTSRGRQLSCVVLLLFLAGCGADAEHYPATENPVTEAPISTDPLPAQPVFQFDMNVERAIEKTGTCTTGPIFVNGMFCSLLYFRVIG